MWLSGIQINFAFQVSLSGAASKTLPVLRLSCAETNEALVVGFKKGFIARVATSVVQEELEVSQALQLSPQHPCCCSFPGKSSRKCAEHIYQEPYSSRK